MEMNLHYAASSSSDDDLTLSTTTTSTSLHSITSSSIFSSNNKLVRIKDKGMKKNLAPKITRPCTECGRKFWSWKALFGCHPERHWRGINPPPNSNSFTPDEYDAAASLLMLANGLIHECSSCNKVFSSHQALGGHRASHKNVKGCFAITTTNLPADQEEQDHKCSICLRVFSSGQALGGHMRCHNSTINPPIHLHFNAPDHPHHFNLELDLDLRLGAL